MGPPSPVTVPTASWSGRNGSDREPSGASLMRVSRAGSLASRTTNSWWARSSAGVPLSRVSRYWRASSFSPLRAAFRKPRTVPRVYCDREGPGAPARRRSSVPRAVAPGTGWASTPGVDTTRARTALSSVGVNGCRHSSGPRTSPAVKTANHVPLRAPPSRQVFLPAPRCSPRNPGGRPSCRTAQTRGARRSFRRFRS